VIENMRAKSYLPADEESRDDSLVEETIEDLLDLGQIAPVGTIIERRGNRFQARRI
jgi:hypothetical protein